MFVLDNMGHQYYVIQGDISLSLKTISLTLYYISDKLELDKLKHRMRNYGADNCGPILMNLNIWKTVDVDRYYGVLHTQIKKVTYKQCFEQ